MDIDIGSIIIWVILGILFIVGTIIVGLKALKDKVTSGIEGIVGRRGVVKTDLNPSGIVLIEGEDWDAESEEDNISKGEKVIVVGIEGLKLKVKKFKGGER